MSYADEARYGRASLLLLNVCPFTLRHVINDYHLKNGYTSLQDFLDKNKHDLYHILNRRCCCRLIQSRSTPMNRSQWDLLFIKTSSSCRRGCTGDCPCQYDAKPGVTPDVMDITLCCLFIKNICYRHAGINMSHVDTISTIRNHIIHAEKAQLDVLTYNGYWNQVKTALLDLSNHASPTVHTDTLGMIQDLETRTMNAGELGEIRKVLVDQKRMEEVEENLSDIKGDLDTTNKNVANVEENVSQLEGNVSHLERNMRNVEGNVSKLEENVKAKFTDLEGGLSQTSTQLTKLGETAESSKRKLTNLEQTVDQKIKQMRQEVVNPRADNQTDGRVDVTKLKQELIRVNEEATRNISISPLQEGDDKVPIELLYASVVIREDPKYAERENYSFEDTQDRNTASELDVGRFDSSSHGPTLPSRMFSSSLHHQTSKEPQMQAIDLSRLYHQTPMVTRIPAMDSATEFDIGGYDSSSQTQSISMPRYCSSLYHKNPMVTRIPAMDSATEFDIGGYDSSSQTQSISISRYSSSLYHQTPMVTRIPAMDSATEFDIGGYDSSSQTQSISMPRYSSSLYHQNPIVTRIPAMDSATEFDIGGYDSSSQRHSFPISRYSSSLYLQTPMVPRIPDMNIASDFDVGSYNYDSPSQREVNDIPFSASGGSTNSYPPPSSSQTRREVTNPDDIFKKDGKITKNIYMLGYAAHGKTTYCLWLAKKWCNAQQRKCKEIQVLDMWEKTLLEFDFVFLLKLRYVNANRASVIDMICQDTLSREKDCHETVRHVLSSDKYRSLIIMDGLDEWNPNDESS